MDIAATQEKGLKSVSVMIAIRVMNTSNVREHWIVKSKRNQAHKEAVKKVIAPLIADVRLPCKIILTRIAPRAFDYDGLVVAMKSVRDQVANCFFPEMPIGKSDDLPCFEWVYAHEKGAPKQYLVKITIEENQQSCNNT